MRRRALLGTLAGAMTASTAGCLDLVSELRTHPMQLARLSVSNWDSAPHRFDLRVDRDGETVHRSSHEIPGKEDARVHGEVADCDWGTTPGDYELFARVDGGDWEGKSLDEVDAGGRDTVECATAQVRYEESVWIRLLDNCDSLAYEFWVIEEDTRRVCPIDYSRKT
ncbi:hypothetical protein [Halosolutus halophilus]|uniref:hypothetical protein n=1 Tax=Halosolutus halophilus TaxID=1552990 RepID=UPI0022352A80|nr:hypothetical protein [Halosolutus halophilus]